MTRIIEKTLTQLEDRVDHGEATGKLDADGNPLKLPMRGRDLAVAGAIIFDKRQLLRSHLPVSAVLSILFSLRCA
jgi:hypothetical protein